MATFSRAPYASGQISDSLVQSRTGFSPGTSTITITAPAAGHMVIQVYCNLTATGTGTAIVTIGGITIINGTGTSIGTATTPAIFYVGPGDSFVCQVSASAGFNSGSSDGYVIGTKFTNNQ